jgi:phosphoribosylaminoimidazolecarboxamide formyltransferase/IMP cyclohydrolase
MNKGKLNPSRVLVLGSNLEKAPLREMKKLCEIGWEFISCGKAAKSLNESNIDYIKHPDDYISELGGHIMLDIQILSGILADRESLQDMERISDLGIETIDIVLINIQKTLAFAYSKENPGVNDINTCLFAYLISAVQNSKYVNVITDSSDCSLVVREISTLGDTSIFTKEMLAKKALDTLACNFKSVVDVARYRSRMGQRIITNPTESDLALV